MPQRTFAQRMARRARDRSHVQSSVFAFLPCARSRASTRPAGERVTFFACAKKVTKESTPQVARLPGILPFRFASGLRGSLTARPCADSELARIPRAPLWAFPPPAPRATWGPCWAASCRRSQSQSGSTSRSRSTAAEKAMPQNDAVQGWTELEPVVPGAVRGAGHRRRSRKMPEGPR